MEGHRGEPRNKPPFPGNYGLHGWPTLLNSVETFADVPAILQRGADWWKAQGDGDSVGWKFFAVSGHVERPGVYCVPMGTTVRALIDRAGGVRGGARLTAVQPGGASSNFIGPDQLDLRLDFGTLAEAGTMLGSGAMVVSPRAPTCWPRRRTCCGSSATSPVASACPAGSARPRRTRCCGRRSTPGGRSTRSRREDIFRLEETLRKTSICGLGQVALGPVVSVLGLDKGGAAARDQPRPDGATEQPDR